MAKQEPAQKDPKNPKTDKRAKKQKTQVFCNKQYKI